MKNKAKYILIAVIMANTVFASFAYAASAVIYKAGELQRLDLLFKTNPEAAKTDCNITLSNQLYKINNETAWKDSKVLVARWNFNDNKCHIKESIPMPIFRSQYEANITLTPEQSRNYEKYYTDLGYGIEPPMRSLFLGGDANKRVVDQTDYAKYVEDKLRTSQKDLTEDDFQKMIGNMSDWKESTGEAAEWSKIVGYILKALLNFLTWFMMWLSAFAAKILAWSISYSVEGKLPDAVMIGWKVIRDMMNLVFILALIVMSIGTILRIEAYSYKKLLPKMILAALLINFSATIAITLIKASNVLVTVLAANSQINNYWTFGEQIVSNKTILNFESGGVTSDVISGLGGLFLAVVMTVSFSILAAMMFVRLIGLWVLIVLSPLAYGLNTLPGTAQYAKQWWNTFIKYLIWAPVAVLLLRLGEMVMVQSNGNSFSDRGIDLFLVSGFMWAAVLVAKQAGMYGGQMVANYAQKGSIAASKYWMRGSGIKHSLGAPAYVANALGSKKLDFLKKPGEWAEKGTSYVEAVPGAVTKGMAKLEGDRQGQVKKAQRAMLRSVGLVNTGKEEWESLSGEDYNKLISSGKMDVDDLDKAVSNAKLTALGGIIQHVRSGKLDAAQRDAVLQALWKRMGGGGISPLTPADITSAMDNHASVTLPGGGSRSFNVGSHNEAFEKSLMTPEQLQEQQDEFRKLATGQLSPYEAANVSSREEALRGIGGRVPITGSVVANQGQRVIISDDVAKMMNIHSDADISKDEIDTLARALKADGVSDTDVSKVMNAANVMGSVAIQKGSFAALKNVLPASTPEQRRVVNRQRVEDKQHERSHGLYSHVKNTSFSDYSKMVGAVQSDPVFRGLKEKLKANSAYKGATDSKLAEEVLARSSTRSQLSAGTQSAVNQVLEQHRGDFTKKTKMVIEQGKFIERSGVVKQSIIGRVGQISTGAMPGQIGGAAGAMRRAAGEMKSAASGIKSAGTDLKSAAREMKTSTTQLKNLSNLERINIQKNTAATKSAVGALKEAAENMAYSAETAAQASSRTSNPATAINEEEAKKLTKEMKNLTNNLREDNDTDQ